MLSERWLFIDHTFNNTFLFIKLTIRIVKQQKLIINSQNVSAITDARYNVNTIINFKYAS